ncbi:MAG: isocitrate lyase/phosphoenolpyruvate mutase family protein [Pseudomonadota bacterium]
MNGKMLKDLLAKKKTLLFPGAHNPFAAKLIEKGKFDGVYLSGAGLSNSLGVPDDGTLTLADFSSMARAISKSVKIPVICDADTGFDDVEKTVRGYIESGVAAIQLEDQQVPKRCGHLPGKEVTSCEEMVEKLKKADRVRKKLDRDFVLVARTDARGAANIDEKSQLKESIERGKAYLAAGADVIFPESLRDRNEFETYRNQVRGWLLANMTEFGKTPFLRWQEFGEIGFNIVIFPVTLFRVAAGQMAAALETLRKEGNQKTLLDQMMGREEINQLLGYRPDK